MMNEASEHDHDECTGNWSGIYSHLCSGCGVTFNGYKRRVWCKVCEVKNEAKSLAKLRESVDWKPYCFVSDNGVIPNYMLTDKDLSDATEETTAIIYDLMGIE